MTWTPWGKSDYSEKVVPGIMFYGTPGHGGYHLSPKRLAQLPEYMRKDGGWYEEDCDWAIIVVYFKEYWPAHVYIHATDVLRYWRPEIYKKWFHAEITNNNVIYRGEIKYCRQFLRNNGLECEGTEGWVSKDKNGILIKRGIIDFENGQHFACFWESNK